MKPVFQTSFEVQGNCLCACIASLLEVDIEEVPNPKHDLWQDEINEWMVKNYGIYMITAHIAGDNLPSAMINSYSIGCGQSKSNLLHAVLCRNGEIVHDPLPNSGLTYDMIDRFDLILKFFGS